MAEFYYNAAIYEMMSWANTTEAEIEELLQEAQGGDTWSINALGRLKIKKAIPVLILSLKHKNADVRMDAANAIGEIGDAEAANSLVPLLQDPDADVREYALCAFAKICEKRFVPDLIPLLNDPHQPVRRAAAETLGILEDARAVSSLMLLLNDESTWLIAAAIEAIGNIKAYDAVDSLLPFLQHEAQEVKSSALYSLAILDSDNYLDELLSQLNQGERMIQFLTALGKVKVESSFQALLKALNEENPMVRYTAVRGLIEHNNVEAIPHLLEALKDDSYSVRENALEGIELMGNEQIFRTLLNHEYFCARELAEKKMNIKKYLPPKNNFPSDNEPSYIFRPSYNFNIIIEKNSNQDD